MDQSIAEKLQSARGIMLERVPYFSSLIYSLVAVEDLKVPTMGVTARLVFYYNPKYVEGCTPLRLATSIMHECMHVYSKHCHRLTGTAYKQDVANVAADFTINPLLRDWKNSKRTNIWDVGPDWMYPEMYEFPVGLSMEEYYDLLMKMPPPPEGSEKTKGVGSGKCGSCSCGDAESKAAEEALDQEYGRSEVEISAQIAKASEGIVAHNASRPGSTPGSLVEMAQRAIARPKVPWQSTLKCVLKKVTGQMIAGGADFSLRNPSKRSYSSGVLRPGIVDQQVQVVFILDTSGSMSTEMLTEGISEIAGCMRAANICEARVVQADTQVENIQTVPVSKLSSLAIHGRGGTDFTKAVEQVAKLKNVDLCIYVTDGQGSISCPKPPCAFIWCIIPAYGSTPPASWGHVVIVGEDQ